MQVPRSKQGGGMHSGPMGSDIRMFMHIWCTCAPEEGGGMLFEAEPGYLHTQPPRCAES